MDSSELTTQLAQRTGKDIRLVVLSYLQRGGSPSFHDRMLATECGVKAVTLAEEEISGKAIGTVGGNIVAFDLEDALKIEPVFNQELYDNIGILSK